MGIGPQDGETSSEGAFIAVYGRVGAENGTGRKTVCGLNISPPWRLPLCVKGLRMKRGKNMFF